MSLCGELRSDAVRLRQHDLTTCLKSHRDGLRALLSVHAAVAHNTSLTPLIHQHYSDSQELEDREAALYSNADLLSGRTFDEASLTIPFHLAATTHDANSIYATNPNTDSKHAPTSSLTAASVDAPPTAAAVATPTRPPSIADASGDSAQRQSMPAITRAQAESTSVAPRSKHDALDTREASARPANLAPPLPEEEAAVPDAAKHSLYLGDRARPAKVVHLPPEDEQEERLREQEADEQHRRSSEPDATKLQRPHAQGDLVSSPSSTIGAVSTATPGPAHTPDTSPDSEHAAEDVLPPHDLRPTPAQQREKEEHDRLLAVQKEIARQQALGDVATPDDQLRWEEREAATREAEELVARRSVGGPEPNFKPGDRLTEAGTVAEEMEAVASAKKQDPLSDRMDVDQAGPASRDTADPSHVDEQDDGDNITVASRARRPPPASPVAVKKDPTPPAETPTRMTTRVSSGAMRQKSVSEILGERASGSAEPAGTQRGTASPGNVSPKSQRQQRESFESPVAASRSNSRRSSIKHSPASAGWDQNLSVLGELAILKGAADDPEKDYLEPLFRIQAHEIPTTRTRTLPDLLKLGPKALSTQDQFITLHERLDFRMLRRIYQLQNANKWSLRQMEKSSEPEQPVTHLDHMMVEMKWMRKDFKAERKLKKNISAWLAQRCAEWVAASDVERKQLQVTVKAPRQSTVDLEEEVTVPEMEPSGDFATEDEAAPPTPKDDVRAPFSTLIIPPELCGAAHELETAGKLANALDALPKVGLLDRDMTHVREPLTSVSKLVMGRVLPKPPRASRKRSRYEYDDENEALDSQRDSKRLQEDRNLPPESPEYALFHPDNKAIRDRLHSNNVFRPPSEFAMPATTFYEFRNGSQWIWEDDQKLRKLAKEYSFNWSLIADEASLPSRYKNSAERRTPWECFERWVELESLPADMKKMMYFKTWHQRLEQSQQAADRRYQAQIAAIQQQQAQNGGQPPNIPMRKKTTPTRVEKRRTTRYLWMVDAFRKLAKKREQQAWKQAEASRAAAQRKSSQTDTNTPRQVKMTPQEFSRKRQEVDIQAAEKKRIAAQRAYEAHQRNLQMARAAQQQNAHGAVAGQQPRPQAPGMPHQGQMPPGAQAAAGTNGQMPPQAGRPAMPMATTRNGHLAVPQGSGQGMTQTQLQQRAAMAQHPNMQQMAQANLQARGGQYANGQYAMPNGNMASPGGGTMTTQQQLQANQAMLAAYNNAQQQAGGGTPTPNMGHASTNQQLSASPSMPPPPAPQTGPQQLSSGHVPQIIAIKNQLRVNHPGMSDENLNQLATQQMKNQSQSNNQARQNAMHAAAGIAPQNHANMQAYAHNQAAFQGNAPMATGMTNGMYMNNGDGTAQTANMSPANTSPQTQQAYAAMMRQRAMAGMRQSPNASHAQLSGSPGVAHASPNMAPATPSMQYANTNMVPMNAMGAPPNMANMNGPRPSSRSSTPQMQRLGSSGSVPAGMGMGGGMPSPSALHNSPMARQASVAR